MAKTFRERMAEAIAEQGDKLHLLESYSNGAVVLWYIVDGKSYNDPYGMLPQYQVWFGDKRKYVGSDRNAAYKAYQDAKDNFIMMMALI